MEAPPRLELGVRVLQTLALPLGYGAIFNCLCSISQDLAKYIHKVSGKKLPVVTTDPGKNAKVIRVLSNTKLGEEEWLVVYDKNQGLLVSGGLPNGVLYATGEFLEKALDCRFLDFDTTFIPKKQRIILPDTLKFAGKPFFKGRYIYRGRTTGKTEFSVRSKLNGGIYAGPEYGWYDRSVDNLNAHTYYLYSKKFQSYLRTFFFIYIFFSLISFSTAASFTQTVKTCIAALRSSSVG